MAKQISPETIQLRVWRTKREAERESCLTATQTDIEEISLSLPLLVS